VTLLRPCDHQSQPAGHTDLATSLGLVGRCLRCVCRTDGQLHMFANQCGHSAGSRRRSAGLERQDGYAGFLHPTHRSARQIAAASNWRYIAFAAAAGCLWVGCVGLVWRAAAPHAVCTRRIHARPSKDSAKLCNSTDKGSNASCTPRKRAFCRAIFHLSHCKSRNRQAHLQRSPASAPTMRCPCVGACSHCCTTVFNRHHFVHNADSAHCTASALPAVLTPRGVCRCSPPAASTAVPGTRKPAPGKQIWTPPGQPPPPHPLPPSARPAEYENEV